MADNHIKDSRPDSQVTRRNLLTVAPAAGFAAMVVGAVPVAAACATPAETPVMALFREWTAAKAAEDHAFQVCEDEAERDQVWVERVRIEDLMLAAPSQNRTDWMLKICAYSAFGESGSPDAKERPDLWAEARSLIG